MLHARKRFIVGIDPGLNTGFAVFDSDIGGLVSVETLGFWSAHDRITARDAFTPENTIIAIENANRISHVWRGARGEPTGSPERDAARQARVSSSVGKNKRDAILLIERFESFGFEVQQIKPTRAKLNAAEFAQLTGWRKRTSEHGRDAGALIYRR